MTNNYKLITLAVVYAAGQSTVLHAHGDHHDHDHDHDHGHHRILVREGHVGIALGFSEEKGLHFFVGLDGHSHGHGGHDSSPVPMSDHGHGHDHDHDHLDPDKVEFVVGGFGAVTIDTSEHFLAQFAPVGSTVFLIPQSRTSHIPYLGLETEELSHEQFAGSVSIELDHFHVPEGGRFAMFTVNALNEMTIFWDTASETQSPYMLPVGAHRHMFWLFTAPGEYKIELEAEAFTTGGDKLETKADFKFSIGGKAGFWKHFHEEEHEGWYHTDLGKVYASQWPWFYRENDTWYYAFGTGGPTQLYWRWDSDEMVIGLWWIPMNCPGSGN
ncbi:MAG: choice-of-anchor M domain-containing protein [Verrucomicrobia bacterium]|nr:choice-of-anchor M domain-containing protein [Verrucomicrobiota bacterium]